MAAAGMAVAAGVTPAHASNPVPVPAPLANHPFSQQWTGAQLNTSFQKVASNDPGNCTSPRTAGITVHGNNVQLTSNGNDCLYLQSPHTYPTADGYVYEEQVNVSSWTPWSSFWMYGNNWPTDGEIDSIEASPTGQNNVSYHYSTSDPTGFSTCSSANSCDGNALPITTPSNAASLVEGLSPGEHYIDIAFGEAGVGKGAIAVWYDGTEVSYVSGTNVLRGGSQSDPYWIDAASTGTPETGSCGNPCGSITVGYLRIFT